MRLRVSAITALWLGIAAAAALAQPAPGRKATAIFAGGCFWCEETAFEGVPGVLGVTSGYIGGHVPNPTYDLVSAGVTGHAEAVSVLYDPVKISYEQLLDIFWRNVDPFQANGQFCDLGTQYRSGIFYRDEAQRKAAEESKRRLEEQPRFKGKIVTEITAATQFYAAEEYHQDFWKKSPLRYNTYRAGCGRDARLKAIWGTTPGGHK